MSISDTKIRSIKPSDKPFKLTDSRGLYLLVNPGSSRLRYLKYRFNRKESRTTTHDVKSRHVTGKMPGPVAVAWHTTIYAYFRQSAGNG